MVLKAKVRIKVKLEVGIHLLVSKPINTINTIIRLVIQDKLWVGNSKEVILDNNNKTFITNSRCSNNSNSNSKCRHSQIKILRKRRISNKSKFSRHKNQIRV
jgi:hypothetical protein